MAKRSDGTFARRERDAYATPWEAVPPLLPFLHSQTRFIEPCCGEGKLVEHLTKAGHICVARCDVETGVDARTTRYAVGGEIAITNPPWDRKILHPIIVNLSDQLPTWLLFDSDWVHTRQAVPYLDRLRKIVSVGRLKWIEGSKFTGKDNVSWHCFGPPSSETCKFYGRLAA